jgi:hypothetical protein
MNWAARRAEVANFMPKGMQDAGTAMHHSASQFALITQEASVDHDLSRPLAALIQGDSIVCGLSCQLSPQIIGQRRLLKGAAR